MDPIKLASGRRMPPIAYGMWKITNRHEAEGGVRYALEVGYRHFDTAQYYDNEAYLGDALAVGGIDRADLFITTKISNENQALDQLAPSFQDSLKNLQTDYADLLLIHFPATGTRQGAWTELEQLYQSGAAKSIGVSNYTIRHLQELLSACTVKPMVNQVELHVYLQQPELVQYCQDHDIVVEAYSPLAHGKVRQDQVLTAIGQKYGKSAAQVMIRWCLEIGAVPLPKSVHGERIRENYDVFDFRLDEGDMDRIKQLDRNLRTCWDPTDVA